VEFDGIFDIMHEFVKRRALREDVHTHCRGRTRTHRQNSYQM